MESKYSFAQAVFGVFVGITLGLLITLNWWGDTWWQIAIACVIGTTFGAFAADPRLAWRIIADATVSVFSRTLLEIRKLPGAEIGLKEIGPAMSAWLIYWMFFGGLFSILLSSDKGADGTLSVLTLGFLLGFFLSSVGIMFVKAVEESQNRDESQSRLGFLPYPGCPMKKFVSLPETPISAALMFFPGIWTFLMMLITVVIFFLLAVIGFLVMLIRLPLKAIYLSRNSRLLQAAVSIIIGILIGTAAHSYWWGWGIGIGFLSLTKVWEQLYEPARRWQKEYWVWYKAWWKELQFN